MDVKVNDNCDLITVQVPQLSDLFLEGSIEEIDVVITYNCCKEYELTISGDTSDCTWVVYGDYLANPLTTSPVDFTGICGIRMDRLDNGVVQSEFPVGPIGVIGCEGCFDISDSVERQALVDAVNLWLSNNGGGTFSITMSDGVPNTPYEESLGVGSVFTMSFTELGDGWRPVLYQGGVSCGNPSGGYYSLADLFFTCGGLANSDFVFNDKELKIRPTAIGKDVFPDGVYNIDISSLSTDGTKVSIQECLFVDCSLSCEVLREGNTDAFLIYYLLKETGSCDCDCQTLCDLLKLTY